MSVDRGPPIHRISFEPVSPEDRAPVEPEKSPSPTTPNRDYPPSPQYTTPPQQQQQAIQVLVHPSKPYRSNQIKQWESLL